MNDANACTKTSCCAWSTRYRWQLWYLGYQARMSKWEALLAPWGGECLDFDFWPPSPDRPGALPRLRPLKERPTELLSLEDDEKAMQARQQRLRAREKCQSIMKAIKAVVYARKICAGWTGCKLPVARHGLQYCTSKPKSSEGISHTGLWWLHGSRVISVQLVPKRIVPCLRGKVNKKCTPWRWQSAMEIPAWCLEWVKN